MKRDYCKGREIVNGRLFEIEFWTDRYGLRWCGVYDIKTKYKTRLFSREKAKREARHQIKELNVDGNRLTEATWIIIEYLNNEERDKSERRQIEDFCNEWRLYSERS